MSKKVAKQAKLQFAAGQARPGPALAGVGVNMPQFCSAFNDATKDRMGDIVPVIITGRSSKIVERRATELKISHLHQGITDKLSKLQEVATALGITAEEIAYIGDDINDLDCIRYCGITACPADAVPVVRKAVNYICERNGGNGAVREFIDKFVSEAESAERG